MLTDDVEVQANSEVKNNTVINNVEIISSKIIVFTAGLAGVGKTTHMEALFKRIPNAVYLDKDLIAKGMLQGEDPTGEYYNKYVNNQTYAVMLELARYNLQQNKIIIMGGYFGNKLDQDRFRSCFVDFDTRVYYFHCSGEKQEERLINRMKKDPEAEMRDADKVAEGKFVPYRMKHIEEHLNVLSKIPHLMIDTENDHDLEKNVEIMIEDLHLCKMYNSLIETRKIEGIAPEKAMGGADCFNEMLECARRPAPKKGLYFQSPVSDNEYIESDSSSDECLPTNIFPPMCKYDENIESDSSSGEDLPEIPLFQNKNKANIFSKLKR